MTDPIAGGHPPPPPALADDVNGLPLGGGSGAPREAWTSDNSDVLGPTALGAHQQAPRGRRRKVYHRTDEHIREEVSAKLGRDREVSLANINVRVASGQVTLEGTAETRRQKYIAEELAADVIGVWDVHNDIVLLRMSLER